MVCLRNVSVDTLRKGDNEDDDNDDNNNNNNFLTLMLFCCIDDCQCVTQVNALELIKIVQWNYPQLQAADTTYHV
jgi:hypothetical protein